MNAIMEAERMMAEEREKRRKEEEENHADLMELRRPQREEEQKRMQKLAEQVLMDHMQEIERRERCHRNWVAWDLKVETERKEIIERSERKERKRKGLEEENGEEDATKAKAMRAD